MKTFLIWSEEHHRWWGPGGYAYCDSILQASRYTETEAFQICDEANRYLRPGEPLREIPVPDPCIPPAPRERERAGTFVLTPCPFSDNESEY